MVKGVILFMFSFARWVPSLFAPLLMGCTKPDGAAQVPGALHHTNHLATESSPYLLQHAHNPVEWYPWRDESLQKARSENKPIFLSIGYSACHWCHVMAHESFE